MHRTTCLECPMKLENFILIMNTTNLCINFALPSVLPLQHFIMVYCTRKEQLTYERNISEVIYTKRKQQHLYLKRMIPVSTVCFCLFYVLQISSINSIPFFQSSLLTKIVQKWVNIKGAHADNALCVSV